MIIIFNFYSKTYIFFNITSLFLSAHLRNDPPESIQSQWINSDSIVSHVVKKNLKWDSLFEFCENKIGLFVFPISFTKVHINNLNRTVESDVAILCKCYVIYQSIVFILSFNFKIKTLLLFDDNLLFSAQIRMKM